MVTRAQICAAAVLLDGVPYAHGQHSVYGLDCIGLLIRVAKDVGILPPDWLPAPYSAQWHLHRTQELLLETLDALHAPCVALGDRHPGDMLLFTFGKVCSHSAILLPDNRIIHAVRLANRVVITGLVGDWRARLHAAYQFPGVED